MAGVEADGALVKELHAFDVVQWLPAGSHAHAVTADFVPEPMCLVRVLVRHTDRVFCVPRAGTGKLDLPTRRVAPGDPDGADALSSLTADTFSDHPAPRFLGAVRNTVSSPADDYEWPVPVAYFGVWTVDARPSVPGIWLNEEDPELRDRHWYPLLAAL